MSSRGAGGKLKTHRGAAKRFKRTAGGKLMRNPGFHRHLLTSKSRQRKRKQRSKREVSGADAARVRQMLPNT